MGNTVVLECNLNNLEEIVMGQPAAVQRMLCPKCKNESGVSQQMIDQGIVTCRHCRKSFRFKLKPPAQQTPPPLNKAARSNGNGSHQVRRRPDPVQATSPPPQHKRVAVPQASQSSGQSGTGDSFPVLQAVPDADTHFQQGRMASSSPDVFAHLSSAAKKVWQRVDEFGFMKVVLVGLLAVTALVFLHSLRTRLFPTIDYEVERRSDGHIYFSQGRDRRTRLLHGWTEWRDYATLELQHKIWYDQAVPGEEHYYYSGEIQQIAIERKDGKLSLIEGWYDNPLHQQAFRFSYSEEGLPAGMWKAWSSNGQSILEMPHDSAGKIHGNLTFSLSAMHLLQRHFRHVDHFPEITLPLRHHHPGRITLFEVDEFPMSDAYQRRWGKFVLPWNVDGVVQRFEHGRRKGPYEFLNAAGHTIEKGRQDGDQRVGLCSFFSDRGRLEQTFEGGHEWGKATAWDKHGKKLDLLAAYAMGDDTSFLLTPDERHFVAWFKKDRDTSIVTVLETLTGRNTWYADVPSEVQHLELSPAGDLVAYSDGTEVTVRQMSDGKAVKVFANPKGAMYAPCFNTAGTFIAMCGPADSHEGLRHAPKPWNVWVYDKTGKEVSSFRVTSRELPVLAFHPTQAVLVVGCMAVTAQKHYSYWYAAQAEYYDLASGSLLKAIKAPESAYASNEWSGLQLSPDGRHALVTIRHLFGPHSGVFDCSQTSWEFVSDAKGYARFMPSGEVLWENPARLTDISSGEETPLQDKEDVFGSKRVTIDVVLGNKYYLMLTSSPRLSKGNAHGTVLSVWKK